MIRLFVREFIKLGSYTAPYTFLGNAELCASMKERDLSQFSMDAA